MKIILFVQTHLTISMVTFPGTTVAEAYHNKKKLTPLEWISLFIIHTSSK